VTRPRGVLVVLLSAGLVATASASPGAERTETTRASTAEIRKLDLNQVADSRKKWVSDELLVQFRASPHKNIRGGIHHAAGARVVTRVEDFHVDVVKVDAGKSVAAAARRYLRQPSVVGVERNLLLYGQVIPNDPRFDDLWGLHNTGQAHEISDPPPTELAGSSDADIDAPEAWDIQQGDPSSVIAVVDSGVDFNHPDLNANIWTNPDEVPANNLDDDANGYVDDIRGWDFGEHDDDVFENDSDVAGFDHGTHVAGTIAAEMDNGTVVAGVCPTCRIMILKFMKARDTDGDGIKDTMLGSLGAELEALAYARREGADVVNASYATYLWSRLQHGAFKRLGDAGVLTAAAAGNSSLDNDMALSIELPGGSLGFSPEYPASFDLPKIVSVAASNHKDQYAFDSGCATDLARWKCSFTNWGHDSVDLAAPGVDIVSTVPGGYDAFNGTSMATPHVAGAAGLIKSQNPTYGAQALKNVLLRSVDKRDSLRTLYAFRSGPVQGKFTFTSGRLNARGGLLGTNDEGFPVSDGNISGARLMRKRKSGKVTWPGDVNDVFKRRFEKGKRYRVVLNGPNNEDFDLLGWRPNTTEIWQLENGCFFGPGPCKLLRYAKKTDDRAADEVFTFRAKKTGVHYIHVSAYLFSGGNYELRVRKL
jgi:subtilisin family serine protease